MYTINVIADLFYGFTRHGWKTKSLLKTMQFK